MSPSVNHSNLHYLPSAPVADSQSMARDSPALFYLHTALSLWDQAFPDRADQTLFQNYYEEAPKYGAPEMIGGFGKNPAKNIDIADISGNLPTHSRESHSKAVSSTSTPSLSSKSTTASCCYNDEDVITPPFHHSTFIENSHEKKIVKA